MSMWILMTLALLAFGRRLYPKGSQYQDTRSKDGWARLWLHHSGSRNASKEAYQIGFDEGSLTHVQIHDFYTVIVKRHTETRLRTFWANTLTFLQSKVAHHDASEAEYWTEIGHVLYQLQGIVDGYNSKATQNHKLSMVDFMFLNGDVSNFDIAASFGKHSPFHALSAIQLLEIASRYSRCSAFVRFDADRGDVYAAHATWEEYSMMNRIAKHVHFRDTKLSFTSYPGMLGSTDDFFVTNHGLVVLETTLNVLDKTVLRGAITHKAVPTWLRSLVASRLAKSGAEWASLFRKYPIGANSDQWLIVDYSKVGPQLEAGAVTIVEEAPGAFEANDLTTMVRDKGYWASYNHPYYPSVRRQTQFADALDKHKNPMFAYQTTHRARLFMRKAPLVSSLDEAKTLIRDNHYATDPESQGCPSNAIAARYDIPVQGCSPPTESGAIDGKVVDKAMALRGIFWMVSGPSSDDQPVYQQQTGEKTTFDFPWVKMRELE